MLAAAVLLCAETSLSGEIETDDPLTMPYNSLMMSKKDKIREVVNNPTVLRTLRNVEFNVDEPILVFMMDHPVFLAETLSAMNITKYLVRPGEDGEYFFDDLGGLIGRYNTTHIMPGQRFFYGTGNYRGLALKLAGKGAILLEYRSSLADTHKVHVNANVYATVENVVVRILTKILKPIVIPLVDRKIYRFIDGAKKLADEISTHPDKVYKTLKESNSVDDKELEEFRKLIFAHHR